MVSSPTRLYIFVGEGASSRSTLSNQKEQLLKKLKEELLGQASEEFNLDILYADELGLRLLQEKLLVLPFAAKQRVILIRQAEKLKPELKTFLQEYIQKPYPHVSLILDFSTLKNRDDNFIKRLFGKGKVVFEETVGSPPNAFDMLKQIKAGRPHPALLLLKKLLDDGEDPERILGAFRYEIERDPLFGIEKKKKCLALLLRCAKEINTGKVRPVSLALERLVLALCGLQKQSA